MLSILNKRSVNHPNWCEDNYFIHEDEKILLGAVLDGCSSGTDSYWASKTISLFFDKLKKEQNNFEHFHYDNAWNFTTRELLLKLADHINLISKFLYLDENTFLSTIVFFVYHKQKQKLFVKFIGDGSFYYEGVDGEYKQVVNDENNMPLYLAYYADRAENSLNNFLNSRPEFIIENVKDFSICTDGIDSFAFNKYNAESEHDPKVFLLKDDFLTHLKAGLSRKFNILTKEGWVIEDDLTIIRYKIKKLEDEA